MQNNDNNPIQRIIDFLINHKVGVITTVVLAVIIYVVTQYSILQVNIDPSLTLEGSSIAVVSASSESSESIQPTKHSSTKIVRRGSYRVQLSNSDGATIKFATTKILPFRTAVDLSIQKEKEYTYIGVNPESCIAYNNLTLFSYACDSIGATAVWHKPANKTTASYNEKKDLDNPENFIEGNVLLGDRETFFITIENDEGQFGHSAVTVDSKYRPTNARTLKGLANGTVYNYHKFGEGFLAYTKNSSSVLYFASTSSTAQNTGIQAPEGTEFGDLNVLGGSSFSVHYTTDIPDTTENAKSQDDYMVIYSDNQIRTFKMPKGPQNIKAMLCAPEYICAITPSGLTVYRIENDKLTVDYRIGGIDDILTVDSKFLAVSNDKIFEFNIPERSGNSVFALGAKTNCGIQELNDKLFVCGYIDPNKRLAALVNLDKDKTFDYDNLLSTIRNQPYVADVSIYKDQVIVTPKLELRYNSRTRRNEYSEQERKKVNSDIKQLLDSQNVPQNIRIYNPFDY